ncbi:canalicular multispecific organic anion transporter 1 [Aplysia californica]|uniref:Canalicular multispecific organic anion transporter 1 n=1 Tax=Aplysia californica TaxID=6500 RepID=A0ABM0JJ98_APLCA|nr:canalicular multispecific organic anion transporter 1 [Aplysia californica]
MFGKMGSGSSSLLSNLLFTWTNRLVTPEGSGISIDLPQQFQASIWGRKTLEAWNAALQRQFVSDEESKQTDSFSVKTTGDASARKIINIPSEKTKSGSTKRSNSGSKNYNSPYYTNGQKKPVSTKNLVTLIWQVFGKYILHIILVVLVGRVVSLMCKPFLFTELMKSFEKEDNEQQLFSSKQLFLFVAIFLSLFTSSLLDEWSLYLADTASLRIKSGMSYLVFHKLLHLSQTAKYNLTAAKINNVVSSDLLDSARGIIWIALRVKSLFNMVGTFVILYYYIGKSSILVVLFLGTVVGFSSFMLGKQSVLYQTRGKAKDEKMSVVTEMLRNMKNIKLLAMETVFGKKVEALVGVEMRILTKIFLFRLVGLLAWSMTPMVATTLVLLSHIYFDTTGLALKADITFAVVILVNELRFSMFDLPVLFTTFYSVRAVFDRLQEILVAESVQSRRKLTFSTLSNPNVDTDKIGSYRSSAISIRNSTFCWDRGQAAFTLKADDISIPKGSLVLVTGTVGSGKTSFLSALCGEMEILEGDMYVNGTTSYVPQEPWILNATIKDNILFGSPVNKSLYEHVLTSCALNTDLESFECGDLFEVKDKGENLSGGQKQRVNLARAAYCQSDIVLLDDPLSAVDNNVARHIFYNLIGRRGLLGQRTRILTTGGSQWLPFADMVIEIRRLGQSVDDAAEYEAVIVQDVQTPRKHALKVNVKEEIDNAAGGDEGNNNAKFPKPSDWNEESPARSIDRETVKIYFKAVGLFSVLCLAILQVFPVFIDARARVGLTEWSNRIQDIYNNSQDLQTCARFQAEIKGPVCISDGTKEALWETNIYHVKLYFFQTASSLVFFVLYQILCSLRNSEATGSLASQLLWSCLRSPLTFFEETPFGQLALRFGHDVHEIGHEVPLSLEELFYRIAYILTSLIVVCYTCPNILLFATPVALISIYIQLRHVALEAKITTNRRKYNSFKYGRIQETIEGVHVIRGFHLRQRFLDMLVSAENESNAMTYAFYAQNRWLGMAMTYMSTFFVMSSAIFASVGESGDSKAARVGLAVMYSIDLGHHMNVLIKQTGRFIGSMYSVKRLSSFFDTPSEAEWDSDSRNTSLMSWPKLGHIRFKDVSLMYSNAGGPALKKVSMTFLPGQKIGIIGRTGAGKSSLVQVLLRLRDVSNGAVYIDNVDISTVGLHHLRKSVSTIPQDPVIFSGTLRWNLDPTGRHNDNALWSTLAQVQLDELVKSLPEGLGYVCKEGGDTFSLGQKQLICLARTLLEKAKIFFFDEATSSLDPVTDKKIQGVIKRVCSTCTVLTIAHRFTNVLDYDLLVLLEAGQVIAMDTPENLRNNSTFKTFFSGPDAEK